MQSLLPIFLILSQINAATFIASSRQHSHHTLHHNTKPTPNHLTLQSTPTSTTPIPPPPPISVPVYSLATPIFKNETTISQLTETRTSMSIVTFASPVSVAPPKLWMVSLYGGTLTRSSFFQNKIGMLQLLSPDQKHLVPLLGKRSGWTEGYSKREACETAGYPWMIGNRTADGWEGEVSSSIDDSAVEGGMERVPAGWEMDVLPECESYICLRLLQTMPAGDHDVALCEVVNVGRWDEERRRVVVVGVEDGSAIVAKDEGNALYTSLLRKEGII